MERVANRPIKNRGPGFGFRVPGTTHDQGPGSGSRGPGTTHDQGPGSGFRDPGNTANDTARTDVVDLRVGATPCVARHTGRLREFLGMWIVTALFLVAAPVRAQQQVPPVGFGRAVEQTAAGVIGMGAGFVGAGLATRWVAKRWLKASDDQASSIALGGAYVGGALGAAAGPTIVGAGPGPRGSYWDALAGAAVGGVGSFLVVHLNRAVDLGTIPRIISTVAVVTLPAIGATVGYNLSRH